MAIEKITQAEIDANNVKSSPDAPTGTSTEIKNIFDKLAELIATRLNNLIDGIKSITDGASGADQIGATPTKTATTVQGQLEELKADKVETADIIGEITTAMREDKIPNEKAIYLIMEAIGAGDMVKSIYDPTNQCKDIFAELSTLNESLSHESLLDNPWFKINQKTQSSYSGNFIYTVDRWNITSGTATISTNGVTINGTPDFFQKHELGTFEIGKTYTISAIVDNVLKAWTFEWKGEQQFSGDMGGWQFSVIDNWYEFNFISINIPTQNQHTIKAIKLELGAISTLHLDAPPNPQVELAKCQRDQINLKGNSTGAYKRFGFGLAGSATACVVQLPIPTSMRANPVPSLIGNLVLTDQVAEYPVTSVSFEQRTENIITIIASVASGLTAGKVYALQANNDATASILLDANM